MARSFDYWRTLANGNLTWRVTDDQAERAVLLDKIACKCCELEQKGEYVAVWHAVHLVTGKPCNCARCNP